MCPNVLSCRSPLESLCTENEESLYTVQPKMKNHLKERKQQSKLLNQYPNLKKWTDFTPDNISLCDSITNDFTVQ